MRRVTFTRSLPVMTLLPPLLPGITFGLLPVINAFPRLQDRKFSARLVAVTVPAFPISLVDPRWLKDAAGDFILGADGDALWGAPN